MTEASSGRTQAGLDPAPLIKLSTLYWDSQVFLTANRIGLFAQLATGEQTLEQLAAALSMQARPLRLVLNACVALGLVEEGDKGFRNSALSQTFLVPGKQTYMGNAVRYSDDMYAAWGALEQALREGAPPMKPESYTGNDPELTRHFVYGMHNRALGIGTALVNVVDLTGRTNMLDVGGGPGTYSALFARRYPQLRSRVFDLPGVVAIAEEIVASLGVGDRVQTLPGDYMRTEFPLHNDVVLISGVFHRETETTCRELIGKAAGALDEGGLLVISDVFTDAGGASPLFATLFGINMMLSAPDGGVHADADVARWMAEAGFADVDTTPFPPPMPHRVVAGVKS